MKSIVSTIQYNSNRKFVSGFDVIPSTIASVFSVIFALSIVFELRNLVEGFVLVLLGVFIVLFLVANEYVKVTMIKRLFSDHVKGSVIPFAITFLLSASLSSIGIWMWTNKTVEHKDKNNVQMVMGLNKVNEKFDNKIDSIRLISFESTQEYKDLIKTIDYWKTRRAMDSDELKEIRTRLDNVQNTLNNKRTMFIERSNVQVESIVKRKEDAIALEKTMFKVNENKKRNLLDTMYLIKGNKDVIDIKQVSYSPLAKGIEWKDLTIFYNSLIGMGILSDPVEDKKILTNNVLVDNVQALTMFDAYHEKKFKYDIELNS